MTTLQASAATIVTTRSGGRISYQAADIGLLDAIASFIVFFLALVWGAVVTAGDDDRIISARPLPVKPNATYGRIWWVWVWQYLRAVFGG